MSHGNLSVAFSFVLSQNSICTATCLPSHKSSDEQYMLCHAGEVRMNSLVTFFYGPVSVGRSARTPLNQLCVDAKCSLEYLQGTRGSRDG